MNFKTKSHLIAHTNKVHLNKTFACDFNECQKVFKTKSSLSQHKLIVHSIEDKNKIYLKCFWPKCQYKTTKKWTLKTHQLSHSEVKQIKSDFNNCNKNYKLSNVFKSSTKTFKCDYNQCNKILSSRRNLFRHKSCVHLNEKKFKCNEENCGKSFCSQSQLNDHMKRHLNIKLHKCIHNNCNQRFVTKQELRSHLKLGHR
ncbi:unnamed protein product [Medioppia subpectinata]|uniref:C2H2-type domain-containing protein n=1 Tax=Medioppia subpectinata TaxID=1979941 RepID=A0A7R9KW90_9ACAR|nr:unnamed protein product [Medioppia subpectinata]CAG2110660.1 unnamed protein product [Medioppia subpectinata]